MGQDAYQLKLRIDTDCMCNDSINSQLNGEFGIYAHVAIRGNSGKNTDTLIRELAIKKEQTLFLTPGNYTIIYTPYDSLESTNQWYFSIYATYNEAIQLNCFFFNKRYPPLLEQMKEKDTLVITSTYVGNTYEGMLIPSHTVVIFKNNHNYYASYFNNEYRQRIGQFTTLTETYKMPHYESQLSLDEEGIEKIREFDAHLSRGSINNNLNDYPVVRNSIVLNGETITFYSKWYPSLLLWNEIITTNH